MRERTTIGRMIVEDQRGAYAVLFGIMSVVVILFAGLAIDVSLVFNERRAAQNAADHAALSAAFADCTGGDAQAAADSSVARNGFVASNLSLVDLGGSEYEATVQTVTEASFARVVGIDTFNISTDARAECLTGGGQAYAMFARGDTCPAAGKEQIEMPGSEQRGSWCGALEREPLSRGVWQRFRLGYRRDRSCDVRSVSGRVG